MTTAENRPAPPRLARRVLRITVLAGGPSAEREVSLESGRAIADALRRRGHDVLLADVAPSNLAALDQPADVVVPALHGTFGEDGTVQHLLESRGLPYVGSDSRVSAIAIDKIRTKELVRDAGVRTPPWEEWTAATLAARDLPAMGLPVVVKPVDQGSSVLTAVVQEPQPFAPAVRAVLAAFGRALVERFIAGDELTVGIVGETVLPPICIRPKRGFYDYDAKYRADDTEYLFDAGHAPALRDEAARLSRRVHDLLGCRHLSRLDWMVDESGTLWFLEVNTLPGFTSHSLVPKAAARAGMDFDELVERLVLLALETDDDRRNLA